MNTSINDNSFLKTVGRSEQILQAWPDGLMGINHAGEVVFCNDQVAQILGWHSVNLVGQQAHEILCSQAADYAHCQNNCPIELSGFNDHADHFEAWWISQTGIYINVDVRVLIFDGDDAELAKILMFRACDEGVISQFEARRLAMFAELSPVPILEIALPLSIEFANPAMTNLMVEYGFNDEGIPNILPQNLETLVEQTITSGETLVNLEIEYADTTFSWHMHPLIKNNEQFVQVYGLDVSELRKIQVELESSKNEADRANEAKSLFLANMSHEIRTPMNAIVGFTDLLMKGHLSERQKSFCQKIKISSTVLLEVVNDILDFSKIEAGKLALEQLPFNLVENIEVLADLFMDRIYDRGIEMVFSIDQRIPAMVVGDSLRFKQILINLVSNAIKFTPKGEVEIAAYVVSTDHNKCRLRINVRDTGKGIPLDKQAKLFAPFTQEDESTTRKFGGTGLGLSICRSLVEMMDGSIGVRSQENKGSHFFFEAEFGIAEAVSIRDQQLAIGQPDPKRNQVILLVDHLALRQSLSQYFSELGFVLIAASELISKPLELIDTLACIVCDEANQSIEWCNSLYGSLSEAHQNNQNLLVIPQLFRIMSQVESPASILKCNWPAESVLEFDRPVKPSLLCRSLLVRNTPETVAYEKSNYKVNRVDEGQLDLHNYSILVVDDNAFNQQLASELLKETKAKIQVVENGQKAVELCQAKRFDFILMDIQMPVMDGYEATRLIKHNNNYQIIIALTANVLKGDKEKYTAAGFDDYISKPIDSKRLHEILRFWLEKRTFDASQQKQTHESFKVNHESQAGSKAAGALSKQSLESMPAEFKGIEIKNALNMLGGKKVLYLRLMNLFRDNFAHIDQKIYLALDSQDKATAGRIVHTIKGSASNLGAESLSNIATQLENDIIDQNQKIQGSMTEFSTELQRTLNIMEEFLNVFDDKQRLINKS